MTDVVSHGTSEPRDGTFMLRFTLNLAHPVYRVWTAVATATGLRGWLAAADPLEPRLGGAVTLRRLNADGTVAGATDAEGTAAGGTVAEGTVTAWDLEHVAEYTVAVHGRIRFHLAPALATNGTVLRFTNQVTVPDDAERLSRLAAWHQHLEYLVEALDGHPQDWSAWTPDRYRELYAVYEAGGKHS